MPRSASPGQERGLVRGVRVHGDGRQVDDPVRPVVRGIRGGGTHDDRGQVDDAGRGLGNGGRRRVHQRGKDDRRRQHDGGDQGKEALAVHGVCSTDSSHVACLSSAGRAVLRLRCLAGGARRTGALRYFGSAKVCGKGSSMSSLWPRVIGRPPRNNRSSYRLKAFPFCPAGPERRRRRRRLRRRGRPRVLLRAIQAGRRGDTALDEHHSAADGAHFPPPGVVGAGLHAVLLAGPSGLNEQQVRPILER